MIMLKSLFIAVIALTGMTELQSNGNFKFVSAEVKIEEIEVSLEQFYVVSLLLFAHRKHQLVRSLTPKN